MPELDSTLEVTKLAAELEVDRSRLEFLATLPAPALRELRATVIDARFARHETSFKRVAGLSTMLPVGLTAKIATLAFGPHLCARIAGVMKPEDAVSLTGRLDPNFMAEISKYLDIARSEGIIGRADDALKVQIGRILLGQREHLVLGRFVSVVSTQTALAVVEDASPEDLLQIAVLTEEPQALNAIVDQLAEGRLANVVRVGGPNVSTGPVATLLLALSPENRARVEALLD